MKYIKKSVKWLLILLGLTIAILYVTDTDYLIKAVRTIYMRGYTTAFLDDYKKFDNQVIANATSRSWPNHVDYNVAKETDALNKINSKYGTVAYVIIKNDSIWFENYYDGFEPDSQSNSFSIAKSYVSGLWGRQ